MLVPGVRLLPPAVWSVWGHGMACRWSFGGVAAALVVAFGTSAATASENLTKHHALSLIGTPSYGPDFKHFDWVNPDAPKGGRARQWALGTFDSLNQFPVKGSPAAGLGLIYDTLMSGSPDEPSTE